MDTQNPRSRRIGVKFLFKIESRFQVEKSTKNSMEENMSKIVKFWREKNPNSKVDNYLVLASIFQFCLRRRSDLKSFVSGTTEKTSEMPVESESQNSPKSKCQVATADVPVYLRHLW